MKSAAADDHTRTYATTELKKKSYSHTNNQNREEAHKAKVMFDKLQRN